MAELINGKTPEEIKRNLSYLVRCEICPQNHEYGCDYEKRTKECQTTDDALALIERLEADRDAALAKVPKWISVEERLPEEQEVVLFYHRFNKDVWSMKTGHRSAFTPGRFYTINGMGTDTVTHWMPLPEPPKGE